MSLELSLQRGGQVGTQDPNRDQMLGDTPYNRDLPAHYEHFEAMVVIKVRALLGWGAIRLAAQGLDFGASLGSFACFEFATGFDSGLPSLPKRIQSFGIVGLFGQR
jgi:hypothetical protein